MEVDFEIMLRSLILLHACSSASEPLGISCVVTVACVRLADSVLIERIKWIRMWTACVKFTPHLRNILKFKGKEMTSE